MSRGELPRLDRKPFIALVDRANRALQADMVRTGHRDGHPELKPAHNLVFGTLSRNGSRAADMAARAGITRQSMGEVIREMVGLDILEMRPDPEDGRAKLVTYSDRGIAVAADGYNHLKDLEERFAAEFGEDDYNTARDVLARIADLLDRWFEEQAAS
ncbi:MarR family transcriptional regulator [Kribbella turkmenica]|uniref:MarR family transcriptional regulator n=1 Tax=Kribbella turkmenica TaxID=2530375 RepID=A0A4V2YG49_9ACTN|nr:MarR family winged helix-turn-helix transcriptional regulator [Kribbella turkmenica]TDD25647.1 MarR family transcriptional regulator [Kribbella turkmenica]